MQIEKSKLLGGVAAVAYGGGGCRRSYMEQSVSVWRQPPYHCYCSGGYGSNGAITASRRPPTMVEAVELH